MKWLTCVLITIATQWLGFKIIFAHKAALNLPVSILLLWFLTCVIVALVASWFDKRKELAYAY